MTIFSRFLVALFCLAPVTGISAVQETTQPPLFYDLIKVTTSGRTVSFDHHASLYYSKAEPVAFEWTFGEADLSSRVYEPGENAIFKSLEERPVHTYSTGDRSFPVVLVVTFADGARLTDVRLIDPNTGVLTNPIAQETKVFTPDDAAAIRANIRFAIWGDETKFKLHPPHSIKSETKLDAAGGLFPLTKTTSLKLSEISNLEAASVLHLEGKLYTHYAPDCYTNPSSPQFVSQSEVLFLKPKNGKRNRLVIAHQGHAQLNDDNFHVMISELVREGYHVMAFNMPAGYGVNTLKTQTGVAATHEDAAHFECYFKPNSTLYNSTHLPTAGGFQLFLGPVVAALDWSERHFQFHDVSMIGLSGGGWTAVWMAATDSRISNTFAVSPGTEPWWMLGRLAQGGMQWSEYYNLGSNHYEAANGTNPDAPLGIQYVLLFISQYVNVYMLSADTPDRTMTVYVHKNDNSNTRGERQLAWGEPIRRWVARNLKGNFQMVIDASSPEDDRPPSMQAHRISTFIRNSIIQRLNSDSL